MSGGRLGADPESLRRLASALERAGEGLEDDARQIGTKIRASGWDGPDARRYLSAWDSEHKPVLIRVGRDLGSTATTLRSEAKAQEKASGEGGSSDGGGGSGDGGGGGGGSNAAPPETPGMPGAFNPDDHKKGSVWDENGRDRTPGDGDRDDDGIPDATDDDANGDNVPDTDQDTDHDGVPDSQEDAPHDRTPGDDDADDDGRPDAKDDKLDVGATFVEGKKEGLAGVEHGDGVSTGDEDGGHAGASYNAWAGGRGEVGGKVGMDESGNVKAEGSAEVAVGGGVEGSAEAGYGDYAKVGAHGSAFVGARAGVDGNLSIGPDGLGMGLGGEAFAGAEAKGDVSGTLMGVTGTAEGSVYAGIGAKANIDANVGWDQTSIDVDLGAALGVGAGVSFSIDVSPKDVVENVKDLMPDIDLPDIDLTPW